MNQSLPPLSPRLDAELTLLRPIGRGGTATVYAARQDHLHREVAVKILESPDENDRERFLREARILATLRHPGIVQVLDFDADENRAYLVMELLPATTLDALMQTEPMATVTAVDILSQLVDILEFAHSQGVIHRDIKPTNVFMVSSNSLKLGDFGAALPFNTRRLTQTGIVLGTAGYMAPEQLAGDTPGPAADQFSLGVISYELLSGRRLFDATDLASLLEQRAAGIPPLRRHRPDLSDPLHDLVMRMLQTDPVRRFPDLSAVRRILNHRPAGLVAAKARRPLGRATLLIRSIQPTGRVRALVAAGCFFLMLLVGFRIPTPSRLAPMPARTVRVVGPHTIFDGWRHIRDSDFRSATQGLFSREYARMLYKRCGLDLGRDVAGWRTWKALGEWVNEERAAPPAPREWESMSDIGLEAACFSRLRNKTVRSTDGLVQGLDLITAAPRSPTGWLLTGRIIDRDGRPDQALPFYRRALELDSKATTLQWPPFLLEALTVAILRTHPTDYASVWVKWVSNTRLQTASLVGLHEAAKTLGATVQEARILAAAEETPALAGAAGHERWLRLSSRRAPVAELRACIAHFLKQDPGNQWLLDTALEMEAVRGYVENFEPWVERVSPASGARWFALRVDALGVPSQAELHSATNWILARIGSRFVEEHDLPDLERLLEMRRSKNETQLELEYEAAEYAVVLGSKVPWIAEVARSRLIPASEDGELWSHRLDVLSRPEARGMFDRTIALSRENKCSPGLLECATALRLARLGQLEQALERMRPGLANNFGQFQLYLEVLLRCIYAGGPALATQARALIPAPPPLSESDVDPLIASFADALRGDRPVEAAALAAELFDRMPAMPVWGLSAAWCTRAAGPPDRAEMIRRRVLRGWRYSALVPLLRADLGRYPATQR